jgi:glycosyltransferase involved in cell wall biosynthesis
MIDFSIIIGTYNQIHILPKVMDAFAKQTLGADRFEVILIDSESTDGTCEYISSTKFPFHVDYERTENKGKVAARNHAFQKAKGNYIFLTDADVIALPNLLKEHLAFHQTRKNSIAVGLQYIVNSPDQLDDTSRPCFRLDDKYPGCKLGWRKLVTGNASASKNIFDKIGFFCKDFAAYGYEDYELGYRIYKDKIPIIFHPSAINYHCHPVAFAEDLPRLKGSGYSAVIFYANHPDFEIWRTLGLNPVTKNFMRLFKEDSSIVSYCIRKSKINTSLGRLAKQFLIEYYYQQGVVEGQKDLKSGNLKITTRTK